MSLKSPAGVKRWKPQHILHVSDDECEAVVGYDLLETCSARILLDSSLKNKNEIQGCVRSCEELPLTWGHFRTLRGGLSRVHYFIRCSGLWGCVSSVNPLNPVVGTIQQSLLWYLLSLWCHFLEYRQVLHIPEMCTTKARSECTSVIEIMLSILYKTC